MFHRSRAASFLIAGTFLLGCGKTPSRPQASSKSAGISDANQGSSSMMMDHTPAVNPEKEAEAVKSILGDDAPAECATNPGAGRKSLRLLTKTEYANSVREIMKYAQDPSGLIPEEIRINGFRNNINTGKIAADHLSAYIDIAIAVADDAKARLQALVGCTEAEGEACAQKVIATLAPKLYRRPLTDAEKTVALNTYRKGFATSPREGMTLLLSSLLISPSFLYRSEIGEASGKLSAYEMASALSYFFWGTPPDDALTALAASGQLMEEETLLAEADRLWKDKRSRHVTDEFARAWLQSLSVKGSTKDASFNFSQDIKDAMALEAEDTFDHLMKAPNATFAGLFTNDYTIGPQKLADFYKAQALNENGISKIKYPNTTRKGLVTLGAVMASHASSIESHPIKRGEFVLKNMLCFVPPPTPPGLEVQIPPKDPNKTTRERFAVHSSSPACAGCHLKLDGIGFGMEDYDTVGVFRSKDNGKDVDSSGSLVDVDGATTPFVGTGAMSALLAESNQAKRCFSLQWYRLAHGRAIESGDGDTCAARDIAQKFSKGEISLGALLLKIVTSPAYLNRGQ